MFNITIVLVNIYFCIILGKISSGNFVMDNNDCIGNDLRLPVIPGFDTVFCHFCSMFLMKDLRFEKLLFSEHLHYLGWLIL